jgi:hypothetical protein
MPITPYLDGQKFDPEARRVMGIAFEIARATLRLEDRSDPICALVAGKIIELAKGGELNPDLLSERALAAIAKPAPPTRFHELTNSTAADDFGAILQGLKDDTVAARPVAQQQQQVQPKDE